MSVIEPVSLVPAEAVEPAPYVPSITKQEGRPPVRVVVALPTHETMEAGFAFDLQKMMARLGASVVADGMMDIRTFMIQGTLVHCARNDLVRDALNKTDCTHVFFLDSDMRFPWQSLLRLLAANKDIVGVNYSVRKGIPKPVAFADLEAKGEFQRFLQPTRQPFTGDQYVKVHGLGMGMVLIRREVFEAIQFPWFETVYDKVNRKWVGEDVDFCIKARAAGYDVWCDTVLSEEIGHVGRMEYTIDHIRSALETREEIAAQQEAQKAPLIVTPEGY